MTSDSSGLMDLADFIRKATAPKIQRPPLILYSKEDTHDDVVFNLVLACFLFLANSGGSHQLASRRAKAIVRSLWNSLAFESGYPDCSTYLCELSCIACACGETFSVGSGLWGMKSHCPACERKQARFFAATERGILMQEFELAGVPRTWTEYACCIAVRLHQIRNNQMRKS